MVTSSSGDLPAKRRGRPHRGALSEGGQVLEPVSSTGSGRTGVRAPDAANIAGRSDHAGAFSREEFHAEPEPLWSSYSDNVACASALSPEEKLTQRCVQIPRV
jgi:hypothetical protein